MPAKLNSAAEALAPCIADLDDDSLVAVLRRALPCPGTVATKAALEARSMHLTGRSKGEYVVPLADFQARPAAQAWRQHVSAVEVPAAVAQAPLFCRSREAEALYDSLAMQPQCLLSLVCKRWWRLLANSMPVKVALCGVADRLPASTEAVIVAWDWGLGSAAAWGRLLAALPRLRTLVVWNPRLAPLAHAPSFARSHWFIETWRLRIWAPPPLPTLRKLRHLVWLPPEPWRWCREVSNLHEPGDRAFAHSIARMPSLRTLVLPTMCGISVSTSDVAFLLRHLRGLETLVLHRDGPLALSDASPLSSLRTLDLSGYQKRRPLIFADHLQRIKSSRRSLIRWLSVGVLVVPMYLVAVAAGGRRLWVAVLLCVCMVCGLCNILPDLWEACCDIWYLESFIRERCAVYDTCDASPFDADAQAELPEPHDKIEPRGCMPELVARLSAVRSLTLSEAWYSGGVDPALRNLRWLAELTQLTALTLDVSPRLMTCDMLSQIAAVPALASLQLRYGTVLEQPLAPSQLPAKLTGLFIDDQNGLNRESLQALGTLCDLKCLTITAIDADSMSCLRELGDLTSLCLKYTPLTHGDGEALARLTQLKRLRLEGCNVKDGKALSALRPLAELQLFSLEYCGGEVVAAVDALNPGAAFPSLRALKISSVLNHTLELNPAAILALTALCALRDLSLLRCTVCNKSLQALATLPELRWLELQDSTGWSLDVLAELPFPKMLLVNALGALRGVKCCRQNGEALQQAPFVVLHECIPVPHCCKARRLGW